MSIESESLSRDEFEYERNPVNSVDNEATRAAGMTSEQRVKAAVPDALVFGGYGEYPDPEEMFYIAGPEAKTDSGHTYVLCEKQPSQKKAWKASLEHETVKAFEAQRRPMRENLDLMRDTTDAVSGKKPARVCGDCGFPADSFGAHDRNVEGFDRIDAEARPCWDKARPVELPIPKPVAPDSGKDAFEAWLEGFRFRYQNGMEFTPVEKDIARHAWNGRSALESKPAPNGEVKVTWSVISEDGQYQIGPNESEAKVRHSWDLTFWKDIPSRLMRIVSIDAETIVETRKKES